MISTVFRATASSSGSQGVAFAGAVRSSSRRSMTRPPQTAVGVSLLCQYRRENSALLNQRHTVGDSPVAEGACPYQGEVGRKGKVGHKAKVGHKGKVGRSHQPTWFVPTKCETAPHPAQRGILRRTDPPQQPAAQRAGPRRVPRPPFGGEGARRAGEGENRPNHKALTRNTARLAGARTSVSAPLGWDRKTIEPLGSQKTRIGNPNVFPTENTLRKGPAPGRRGGRTSVSAPLDWDRKRIVPMGSQAGSTALLSPVPLSRPPAARTSVSAPLDWDRKRIVPMASQKTRIGNPCVPTKNTIRPSHVLKGHS
jgi:hypothetical protein